MYSLLLLIVLCNSDVFGMDSGRRFSNALEKRIYLQKQEDKRDEKRIEMNAKNSVKILQCWFGNSLKQEGFVTLLNSSGFIDWKKTEHQIAVCVDKYIPQDMVKNLIVPYIMIDVYDYLRYKAVLTNCKRLQPFIGSFCNNAYMSHDQWVEHFHTDDRQKIITLVRGDGKREFTVVHEDDLTQLFLCKLNPIRNYCYDYEFFNFGKHLFVYSMFFNRIENKFFLILSNGKMQVRNSFTGKIVYRGVVSWSNVMNNAQLHGISFSPDLRLFATVAQSKNPVRIWDGETGRHVASCFSDLPITKVLFTVDMRYLVASDDTKVRGIIELVTDDQEQQIEKIKKLVLTAECASSQYSLLQNRIKNT